MAGRPPKPTALKLAEGNRGKRKLQPDKEPKFPAGAPAKPAHLKGAAGAEWKRIVPLLEAQGLVTHADLASLVAYCQAYAEMVAAQAALESEGYTITVGGHRVERENGRFDIIGGQVQPHPAIARQRSAWAAVRAFATLFGLNPSARTRVHGTPAAEAKDEFDEWTRRA